MNKRQAKLMDHEYDGIQEYDNPTPGWWHALFIGSIVFAAFYALYWHGNPDAPSIHDRWRASMVEDSRRKFGAVGDLTPDEPTILKMMGNGDMMAVAQGMYLTNCAACHGRDAAGMPGSACPNLTDDAWKNVNKLGDILTVINKGANNGAMPAWENRLSQNERVILAAYVAKLRESPVSGRAPEGNVIPPWPQPE